MDTFYSLQWDSLQRALGARNSVLEPTDNPEGAGPAERGVKDSDGHKSKVDDTVLFDARDLSMYFCVVFADCLRQHFLFQIVRIPSAS
jgi:hypothetical protein